MGGNQAGTVFFFGGFKVHFRGDERNPWRDWETTERMLYEPLLRCCQELSVYCLEWFDETEASQQLRGFLEQEAVEQADGSLRLREPMVLLHHPVARHFWGYQAWSYSLCSLLLFDEVDLDRALRALSYLPLAYKGGPQNTTTNWRERDKRARAHVRKGGFAASTIAAEFLVFYSAAQAAKVQQAVALVDERWERWSGPAGTPWRPDILYGDAPLAANVAPGANTLRRIARETDDAATHYCWQAEFEAALAARGLQAFAPALLAGAERSIGLKEADPAATDPPRSRFGGGPTAGLPGPWPKHAGRPLDLVLDIACAELAPFDPEAQLPHEGRLLFLFDYENQPWGLAPADRKASRLVYLPDEAGRPRRASAEVSLAPRGLSFAPMLALPELPAEALSALGMNPAQIELYFALCDELATAEATVHHRLLGRPEAEQGDMVEHCIAGYAATHAGASTRPEEWCMLLQLDSDDDLGCFWGDYGKLYLWIRRADLQRRHFGDTWTIIQCG